MRERKELTHICSPIVFIGHSLGCLIIKKALADIALMGVYVFHVERNSFSDA
jgi:predicted alpha/beta hydrolase family esterase